MKKVKRVRRGLSLLLVVLLILSLLPAGALAVSSSTQVGWKQYYGHNSNNTMVSTADSAKGHFKIYIGTDSSKYEWSGLTTQSVLAQKGITIVPDEGYYVKQVVIACNDNGGYACKTARRDAIAKFGSVTMESAAFVIPAANLQLNAQVGGNKVWHDGAGTPLYVMVWLGTSPNPATVTYDAGTIGGVSVSLQAPIVAYDAEGETNDGVTFAAGYPRQDGNVISYKYTSATVPSHKVLDINSKTVRSGGASYTFDGWKAYYMGEDSSDWRPVGSDGSVSVGAVLKLYSNYKLVAQWEKAETFTVTYQPGAHGTLAGADADGNVVYPNQELNADTPEAPEAAADDGWYFTGWAPARAEKVTEDAVYVAQYAQKEEITVNIKGNTKTVTYNGQQQTVSGYEVEILPEQYQDQVTVELKNGIEAAAVGTDVQYQDGAVSAYPMGLTKDSFSVTPSSDLSGKVTITVNVSDGWLQINPAAAVVKADSKSMIIGQKLPELTAAVTGVIGQDTLDYTLSCDADGKTAGIFDITAEGNAVQGNYTVSYENGTLTVSAPQPIKFDPNDPDGDPETQDGLVKKVLKGDAAGRLTFTAEITPAENAPDLLIPAEDTAQSDAAEYVRDRQGSVTMSAAGQADFTGFGMITFVTDGTYSYTVQEIPGDDANVAYDSSSYTFTITVVNSNGVLEIADTETVVITNSCTARYMVRYTDGVPDEVVFEDETHPGLISGTATPAFNRGVDPVREGYVFTGWTPEVEPTVTRTMVYTAQWEKAPVLEKNSHFAYIVGYADDGVHPEANITRAEAATIFFRLMTDESRAQFWCTSNTFTDVNADDWFNNAISTLQRAGVIEGSGGAYRPNDKITRAELAVIATRFDHFVGTAAAGVTFTDIQGHWAQKEIEHAAAIGWVEGYSDGTFRPDQYITRAETMTLVNRVLERAVRADGMLDGMITWWDNHADAWYYADVQEATNSHSYIRTEAAVPGYSFNYEQWLEIQKPRDWEALEQVWSSANS